MAPLTAGEYYWDPAHTGGAGGGSGTWYPSSQNWYVPNAGGVAWSSGSLGIFTGNPGYALLSSSINGGISASSLSAYNNYVLLDKDVTSAPPITTSNIGTVHFGSGLTTIDWAYRDCNNTNTGVTWNTQSVTADQGAAVMFYANNLGLYKAGSQSVFSVSNLSGLIGGSSGFWLSTANFNTSIFPYMVYAKNDTLPFYNFVGYDSDPAHNSLRALVTANENNNQQDGVIVSGSYTTENVRLTTPQNVSATTTINSLVLDGLGYASSNADITGNGTLVITSGALLVLTSPPNFTNPVVFPNGVEGRIFMGSDAGWNQSHYYPYVRASFSGTGGLTITGQIIPSWNYVNDTVNEVPNNDTMTLSGNSSYTGVTTLNAIRVAISAPSNFGMSSSVVLNAYAALAPTANNFLRGNQSLALNAGSMLDASGLITSTGNITFGSGSQGVTMTANTTLYANGSVAINPGAILNLVLPGIPQAGQSFTLISGAPISGVFSQINATYQNVNYPFNVSYSGNSLVATYGASSTVPVTVTTSPAGLSFAVDGTTYTVPQAFQWTPLSSHTIAVTSSPQSAGTGIQNVYGSWSDGGAQSHSIAAPSSAATYTANFTTQYFLTILASPAADGTISPASAWVNSGASVEIGAAANSGYQFTGFTGAASGTTTPVSLSVNAPAAVTANFASSGSGSSGSKWYNTAWSYQKALTISHTQVSGSSNLSNFPVLISLAADASLAANAQSTGNDILFTDAGGNKLSHEIENFNPATGQLAAWVQVPTVSPAADTVIYMYFGNPSAVNQQNNTLVWDANYRGVWHLSHGSALNAADSTSNGNNGTVVNAQSAAGEIGGGANFNGGNASVDLGGASGLGITGPITAEAWINVTGWPANGYPAGVLGMGYNYASSRTGWMLEAGTDNGGNHYLSWSSNNGVTHGVSVSSNAATGTWHQVVGTFDGATWKMYLDGAAVGSSADAAAPVNSGDDVVAGGLSTNGYGTIFCFNGLLDELRVSNTARSADWIATQHNNQSNPGNFLVVGAQQTGGGSGGGTAPVPVPVTVTTSPAGLSFAVDGTTYTAPQAFQWTPLSSHTIAVTSSPQSAGTGIQNVYGSWSDGGAQSHSIAAPSSAATYTANFTTQYFLTILASPAADGTVSPASAWVNNGTAVEIGAAANSGYQFTGFTGAASGTTTPVSVTVNAPAAVTANFTSSGSGSGGSGSSGSKWYNSAWSYQKALTISHTQVSGSSNLSNFPVLISLAADASLAANAQSTGNDILFTDAGGNKLSHEIENFNPATGQLAAWVQVPTVSPAVDTVIYMYFGNPSAGNQQNNTLVWDANYRGVWHLSHGTALNAADSTSNGNNGTVVNAQSAAGEIGGGANFNGGNASVDLGGGASGLGITGPITAEAWINVTGWPANGYPAGVLGMGYNYASSRTGWMLEAGTDNGGNHYLSWSSNNGVTHGVSVSSNVATGTWHQVVGTFDGATWKMYLDGAAVGSSADAAAPVDTGDDVVAGGLSTNGYGTIFCFNGLLDELRVSNTARSADWIATQHNNQSNPGNFLVVGAIQTAP